MMRIDGLPPAQVPPLAAASTTAAQAAGEAGANAAPLFATAAAETIYRVLETLQSLWRDLLRQLEAPAAGRPLAALLPQLLPDIGVAPDFPALLRQQRQSTQALADLAQDLLLAWRVIDGEEGAAPLLARDVAALWSPAAARQQWVRQAARTTGNASTSAAAENLRPDMSRLLAQLPADQAARLRAAAVRWQDLLVSPAMTETLPAELVSTEREYLTLLRLADLAPWLGLPGRMAQTAGQQLQQVTVTLQNWSADQTGSFAWQVMLLFCPAAAAPTAYPVYLRVYPDSRRPDRPGAVSPELWLRLCVATDNLGVVDLLFCLSNGQTAVTAVFRQQDGARLFEQYKGELTAVLAQLPIPPAAVKAAVGKEAGMYDARG